jgi:hypothetical protein
MIFSLQGGKSKKRKEKQKKEKQMQLSTYSRLPRLLTLELDNSLIAQVDRLGWTTSQE